MFLMFGVNKVLQFVLSRTAAIITFDSSSSCRLKSSTWVTRDVLTRMIWLSLVWFSSCSLLSSLFSAVGGGKQPGVREESLLRREDAIL